MSSIVTSTLAYYAHMVDFYQDGGVINESSTIYLTYGTTYKWAVYVAGSSIASVKIGSVDATGTATHTTGTGYWIAYATPESLADFKNNCTYTNILVNVTSTGGYYNSTTQRNITEIPCVESGSQPSSITQTAETLILDYGSSGNYQTVVWMPTVTYNNTHKFCPYSVSNAITTTNVTPTATANMPYCALTINKTSSQISRTLVEQDLSLSIIPPSGISYTQTIAGLVVIVGVGSGAYLLGRRRK